METFSVSSLTALLVKRVSVLKVITGLLAAEASIGPRISQSLAATSLPKPFTSITLLVGAVVTPPPSVLFVT